MDKNTILKMAQNSEDERETAITVRAHKIAGNVSILLACLMALAVIVDGYILESNRYYDFLTVAFMLIGVGAVNNAVFSCYQLILLKKTSRLLDVLVFGALAIGAVMKLVSFYLILFFNKTVQILTIM